MLTVERDGLPTAQAGREGGCRIPSAVERLRDAAMWAIMGDMEEYRMSETRRAILKCLEDTDEPLSPKDIADALDLKENVVRQRLYQMSETGDVRKVARGLYASHNDRNNRNGQSKDVTAIMDVTADCISHEEDATWPRHRLDVRAKRARRGRSGSKETYEQSALGR
jgi:Fe2+ or Zn2+ uptake regulation protein